MYVCHKRRAQQRKSTLGMGAKDRDENINGTAFADNAAKVLYVWYVCACLSPALAATLTLTLTFPLALGLSLSLSIVLHMQWAIISYARLATCVVAKGIVIRRK